jgi:catechol 2,3-dioxygenase-like lactoylglutathione lyase family enzyme
MRLDHIAYRTLDRDASVNFFKDAFGYKEQAEFDINLEDGSVAKCMALEPPEKLFAGMPFSLGHMMPCHFMSNGVSVEYHMAPEVFVSSGPPGSLIYNWVMQLGPVRGGNGERVGGIHHLAYQVPSVKETMALWLKKGWAEFTTEAPLECEDLTQVFTKPCKHTGVIYEFIERKGQHGFCRDNVGRLMQSTASLLKATE